MTWNELRKAVLTKMFASENGAVNLEDRDHADYLVSMPQAANEAMQYICAAGRRPRRSALIPVRKKTTRQMVDIDAVCSDYFGCGNLEAYARDEDGVLVPVAVSVTANSFLTIPPGVENVLWFYDAKPQYITPETDGSTIIDMDEDTLPLIALYMAAELYKDDDVQIATIYRNEFEAMLAALSQKPQGVHGGEFTSVTGWYE